jgi:hypothetical protein
MKNGRLWQTCANGKGFANLAKRLQITISPTLFILRASRCPVLPPNLYKLTLVFISHDDAKYP